MYSLLATACCWTLVRSPHSMQSRQELSAAAVCKPTCLHMKLGGTSSRLLTGHNSAARPMLLTATALLLESLQHADQTSLLRQGQLARRVQACWAKCSASLQQLVGACVQMLTAASLQIKSILATALERGPIRLDTHSAHSGHSAALGTASAGRGAEASTDPLDLPTDEGATPGALSDAALVASSVLSALPRTEVRLVWDCMHNNLALT